MAMPRRPSFAFSTGVCPSLASKPCHERSANTKPAKINIALVQFGMVIKLNPLHVKFFRGNINIYLHFVSFYLSYKDPQVTVYQTPVRRLCFGMALDWRWPKCPHDLYFQFCLTSSPLGQNVWNFADNISKYIFRLKKYEFRFKFH